MGLLKKKVDDATDTGEDVALAPSENDVAAAGEPAIATDSADPLVEAAGELTSVPAASDAVQTIAAAPEEAADDLLNMFESTQVEGDDRSVVLDLAGNVDLADLLEELQDVAAALGVVAAEVGLAA
jgi:hypothetical protein